MSTKTALAKISRPRISRALPRTRLFRLLDFSRKTPITWVAGPAGSGKTTLLASYLDARKLPCMWYQLDSGDADIASFFYYLGRAAKNATLRNRHPLPLLTPEYLSDVLTFSRRYFERLCSRLPRPFILVFDNYHDVTASPAFPEVFKTGLSAVPAGITVFILSRAEPPAEFAGAVAGNVLNCLGWKDLRLSEEESRKIALLCGDARRRRTISWIHEKTDGWAAGLILFLKALRGEAVDPDALPPLPREKIFDYFATELFDKLDRETADFLLRTAFFPSMTPALSAQLTGSTHCDRILSYLHSHNYFTEKKTYPELMYQYHPLFRTFLLTRAASALGEDGARRIRLKAAHVLEAAGHAEDAVELYRDAGDQQRIISIVLDHAQELMSQGRSMTLRNWLSHLPDEVVEQTAWLSYWRGACFLAEDWSESRRCFERAFHRFRNCEDRTGTLLAWSGMVDCIAYEFGNTIQLGKWIKWFRDAFRTGLPGLKPEIEYRVVMTMVTALMFSARASREIDPWARRASELMHQCPDRNLQIQSGLFLALLHLWRGDLDELGRLIREQKRWGQSGDITPLSRLIIFFIESNYHWLSGHPDFGFASATAGLEVSAVNGVHDSDGHLIVMQVEAELNRGNLEKAAMLFPRMESAIAGDKQQAKKYHLHLAPWHALLKGDFEIAYRLSLDALTIYENTGKIPFHCAFINAVACHALIELGEYRKALRHITAVAGFAKAVNSPFMEFSARLLEARCIYKSRPAITTGGKRSAGRDDRGAAALRTALGLGKKHGYLNTLAWYPAAVADLCIVALALGIERDYVRDLIRKHGLQPPEQSQDLEAWPWPLKIHTFGEFKLTRAEKPIRYSRKAPKKPLELLRLIIAHGGRNLSEQRLTDVLWPDAEGDSGRKSLSVTLTRLRDLLSVKDAVQVNDGMISLNERVVWTDVRAFEALLAERERKGKDASGTSSLEKMIHLYTGHFLDGESGSWAISPRERLRESFLRAVEALAGHWEQKQDWRKAIEVYRQGIEADDLLEKFYVQIMSCLLRIGSPAEALSVYRRLKKTLDGYGVQPSARTLALYRQIQGTSRTA